MQILAVSSGVDKRTNTIHFDLPTGFILLEINFSFRIALSDDTKNDTKEVRYIHSSS
jgi:hypothetical protein